MARIIAKASQFKYQAIIVAIMVGVSIYFFSNSGKASTKHSSNPEFSQYISAFTAGTISREGTIRIQLTGAREDSTENSENLEDLFDFEPNIDGKISWIDPYTIEFKPDKMLPTGTSYQGTFHLGELLDVADSFDKFFFTFHTITQSFELSEPMLEAIDPQALIYQRYVGDLITADAEEKAKVETILSASQKGKNLKIKWEHAADNRTHRFVIDSLIREKNATSLTLKWDGSDAGIDMKGSRELKIPALGDFKVMNAVVMEGEEQYISVRFSDPLLPNQDLDGLIRLSANQNEMRSVIDKNEIRVYPTQHLTGTFTLTVSEGIQNILSYKMPQNFETQVTFADILPAVKMLGNGVIIPNTEQLILPFEAVSLKAVDVTIVRIYENNVDQFLQVNNLSESNELKRVGRPVIKKTIRLDNDAALDLRKTNRFALDLSKIMKAEPGAIY
ncbi:MAG: alpha-2-macroglobulin family protein, partial [Bacteroidia bacterium]